MTTWNPQHYAASSGQQQKWARELIAKLALRGDERILDIGCGDGKVTAELAAAVPRGQVVGVDSSPEMIAFANDHFGTLDNLRLVVMDASRLDFVERFDLVFSNAALHWVFDHSAVLRGIRNALVPAGRLLLQMGGRGNAQDMLEILNEVTRSSHWTVHFRSFSFRYGFHEPEEYRTWMRQAGLEPVRVELIPKDMTHGGAEGLAAWFTTTWLPWLQCLPEEVRGPFTRQVVDAYLRRHPLDDAGRAHVAMVRLEVEGRRI